MSSNTFDGMKPSKKILELTGLWPTRHPTLYAKISGTVSILSTVIFVSTMIMECVKLIHNYDILTEHLSIMLSPVSFLVKLIIFKQKTGQFIALYQKLSIDEFNNYPKHLNPIIKKTTRTSLVIGTSFQMMCYLVCLFYCVMPLFSSRVDMPIRFSYDMGSYKSLMYIFQIFCMFTEAANNSCFDVLAMSFMGLAAAQIDIFNKMLTNFKGKSEASNEGTQDYILYLNQRVKHHNEIIRYVQNIEDVFSTIFLVQYLSSGALICNIGLQLVHIHPLSPQFTTMVFYFSAMMCQLGMYCWYGNEIIIKSTDTIRACYESDWTDCDLKIRKMLIIISERSKRPLFLTAGKFSVLSLSSFASVINTSYSYFAIMQRLYSKSQN